MKLQKSVINFDYKKKPMSYTLFHNLASFGLNISAAFVNYVARNKKINERHFCDYVKSKNSNIICVNEEDYQLYFMKRTKKL